jgi:uridylate kinase
MSGGSPDGSGERILVKISGEILAGPDRRGIDTGITAGIAGVLVSAALRGYRIGLVSGGGNFVRGSELGDIRRTRADFMGMLATVINGMALQDAVEKCGGRASVLSAIGVTGTGVETFSPDLAGELLDSGHIVIYTGGTGNPYLTTDTAAALRAVQTGCSTLYKGTKVDGVYDRDPAVHPDAVRFSRLSYGEVLERDLKVMDAAAVAVCRAGGIPIVVFDVTDPAGIDRAIRDPGTGTVIGEV